MYLSGKSHERHEDLNPIVPPSLFRNNSERFSTFGLVENVHDCEFLGHMFFSYPAVIIAEGYIRHSVMTVLNYTVRMHGTGQAGLLLQAGRR